MDVYNKKEIKIFLFLSYVFFFISLYLIYKNIYFYKYLHNFVINIKSLHIYFSF